MPCAQVLTVQLPLGCRGPHFYCQGAESTLSRQQKAFKSSSVLFRQLLHVFTNRADEVLPGASVVTALDWDSESCKVESHPRQVTSGRASGVKTHAQSCAKHVQL